MPAGAEREGGEDGVEVALLEQPEPRSRADPVPGVAFGVYRGTSLIRNRRPLGPYSRTMPRAIWWS